VKSALDSEAIVLTNDTSVVDEGYRQVMELGPLRNIAGEAFNYRLRTMLEDAEAGLDREITFGYRCAHTQVSCS
jgi:hypothetical protein